MVEAFQQACKQYIQEHEMFQPQDSIVVGVSGGADSVALLLVLQALSQDPECAYHITAFHVEHGIRGQESLGDAAFVENLCKDRGIAFYMEAVDAPNRARKAGISLEEAAREARYDALLRYSVKTKSKLAIAHHGNDNVETMLFQLARGSGLRGFAGIQPVRQRMERESQLPVTLCRPLLFATREEILQYLQEMGQPYRTDSTNGDVTYHRNRIRKDVIPVLESIQPAAVSHMMQAMEVLQPVLREHFQRMAGAMQLAMDEQGELHCDLLQSWSPEMQAEVLHEWLRYHSVHAKDVSQKHVEALRGLLEKEVGKSVDLPGARVVRTYETLRYDGGSRAQETEALPVPQVQISHPVTLPDTWQGEMVAVMVGAFPVKLYVETYENHGVIPDLTYTKCFDYDKIQGDIQFRNRQTKDRIAVLKTGSKKLKDYFIDAKIPKELRDDYVVLAAGSQILWIVGDRISEAYKVDAHTKRILKIEFGGMLEHE